MTKPTAKHFRIIPDTDDTPHPSLVGVDPDLTQEDNGGHAVAWVDVTCGLAISRPRWQTPDIYESDECPWEGRVRVDAESFEAGMAQTHCPECGQDLQQENGHIEAAHAPQ